MTNKQATWTVVAMLLLMGLMFTGVLGSLILAKQPRHRRSTQSEWMRGYEWGRRDSLDGRNWPTHPYHDAPRPSFTHLERPDETRTKHATRTAPPRTPPPGSI